MRQTGLFDCTLLVVHCEKREAEINNYRSRISVFLAAPRKPDFTRSGAISQNNLPRDR